MTWDAKDDLYHKGLLEIIEKSEASLSLKGERLVAVLKLLDWYRQLPERMRTLEAPKEKEESKEESSGRDNTRRSRRTKRK